MRALGCRRLGPRCERSSGPNWDAAWPQRCVRRLQHRGRWPQARRRSLWEGRRDRRHARLPRPETIASCASSVSRRVGSTAKRSVFTFLLSPFAAGAATCRILAAYHGYRDGNQISGCGDRGVGPATEGVRVSISIRRAPSRATFFMTRRTAICGREQRSFAFAVMRGDGR